MNPNSQKHNKEQTRRNFFHSLAGKIAVFAGEMKGIPQMKLNDLNTLSDEIIEKMIPVFTKDLSYKIESDQLMRYNKKTEKYDAVTAFSKQELYIIKSFDEINTIGDIASDYAEKYKQEKDIAYQKVKSLFINLAESMVCHPKDAHL